MKPKFLVLFFCAAVANAFFVKQVFAISAEYQRCKSGADCTIGEFLYDDSYSPVTTAVCTLTSRTPAGSLYLSSATAPHISDGWYAYTFNTAGATEGLYPSRLCCSVSGSTMCIDKSFNVGPSFVSSAEISDSVWNANIASNPTAGTFGGNLQNPTITAATIWGHSGRTLDSFGTLIADIWGYSTRSLTTFGTLIADVWTNSTRTLSGAALSDGGSIATANQVISATTAVTNLSGQIAGVSGQVTGVTTAVGNLSGLPNQLAAVSNQITGVQTASNNMVVQIAGVSAQVSGVNTAVGNLSGLPNQIAAVSGQVTGVQTAVNNIAISPPQIANAVWNAAASSYPTAGTFGGNVQNPTLTSADIWNNPTRTLTSFGTLIADLWAYSSRTLTSGTLDFGSLVADIWGYSTRNLTSGTLNSGTLALQSDVTSASTTLGTQIGGVASQVSGVTTAVNNQSAQIAAVSGQVTEVTTAVGNLSGLPGQLAAVSGQVTGVQTAVNSDISLSNTITGQLIGASGQIVGVQTAVNNQVNQIAAVSNQVTGVNTAVTNVPANVWANPTRTLSSFGTLIADIWSYASRTLTGTVDVGSLVADVWAYSTRNLTSGTLNSGTLALQSDVTSAATTLGTQVGGVASQVSGVNTAVSSLNGQIAGVSGQVTGVTTAVGNLSGLPNQIAAVSGQVTGVQTSSNNIVNLSNTITGQVIGASSQITGVQTSVNNQAGQIAGVSNQVTGVNTAVTNVPANVWANPTRTLSSFGTLIADIWSYASRTLTGTVDVGSLVADVWTYSTRNLTSATLDSGSLATQANVTSVTSTLGTQIGGVASQVSGVTTAVGNLNGQIAGVSGQVTGVTTAVGNLSGLPNQLAAVSNQVTGVQTSVNTQSGQVTAVSNQIAGVSGQVTGVQTASTNIAGQIIGVQTAVSNVPTNVWTSPSRTLSSFGTLIADIWTYSSRTLTGSLDFGTLVADVWSYSTRNLTSGTLNSGTLAVQTDVTSAAATLGTQVGGVASQVSGVHTAVNSQTAQIAGVSTQIIGVNTAVNNLAAEIPSVIDITDAVWTAAVSSYPTAGTFGGNNQSPNITAANVWASPTRTLSSFGTLVADIWSNASRTLTSGSLDFGTLVSDIWGYSTRNLTSSTLDSGSLATQANLSSTQTTILGATTAIENKIDILDTNLDSTLSLAGTINTKLDTVDTNVDTLLSKWSTYSITDVLAYVDSLEATLGTNSNTCGVNTTIFGDIKCLRDKWGAVDADDILTQATTAATTISNVRSELNYNGKSTTAYEDLQTLVTNVASMQGLIGATSDSDATATVFGRIKKVQNTVETLDTSATDLTEVLAKWESLTATDIYDKVSDVYDKLSDVDDNIASLVDLGDRNEVDVKELKNSTLRMRAVIDVSRTLLESTSKQPIIKTWLEEGSIIFKTLITNPSEIATQAVPLKYYLPRETTKENIMKMDAELSVEYDVTEGAYFVKGNFVLAPNESRVVSIEVTDVWKIPEEQLNSIKEQSEQLAEPLKGTAYFAQGVVLKSDIQASIDNINRLQASARTPEERIKAYREATIDLNKINGEVSSMRTLATSVSSSTSLLGSLGGTPIRAVWSLALILIVGFVLMVIYMRAAGLVSKKTVESTTVKELPKEVLKQTPKQKSVRSTKNIKSLTPLVVIAIIATGTLSAGYIAIGKMQQKQLEVLSPVLTKTSDKQDAAPAEEIQVENEKQVLGKSTELPSRVKVAIPDKESAVNIRAEASINSEIITKLWINTKADKYNEVGEWVEVELTINDNEDSQKVRGWVNRQFIEEL